MGTHKKLITTTLPALLCIMALFLAACGSGGQSGTTGTKASTAKQVFVLPRVGRARYCDV